MTTPPPIPPAGPPRVAVLSHSRLVGEALAVALGTRDLEVLHVDLPTTRVGHSAVRHQLEDGRAGAGLVAVDLDDLAQWREVLAVVEDDVVPWLVATGSRDLVRWGALLDLGCRGIVPMTDGLETLTMALHAVRHRGYGMPEALRDRAIDAWHALPIDQRDLVHRIAALSAREWSVLQDLNEGLGLHDIAAHTGVSEGTIRSQLRTIRQKLGVTSQLAAVAAYQHVQELARTQRP